MQQVTRAERISPGFELKRCQPMHPCNIILLFAPRNVRMQYSVKSMKEAMVSFQSNPNNSFIYNKFNLITHVYISRI